MEGSTEQITEEQRTAPDTAQDTQGQEEKGKATEPRQKVQVTHRQMVENSLKRAKEKLAREGEEKEGEKPPTPELSEKDVKQAKEEPKEEPKAEAKPKDQTEAKDGDKADQEPEKEPVKPPASWDKKAKERWNSLSREDQEYLSKRELERDKAVQQATTERAKAEKRLDYWQQLGQKYQHRVAAMSEHLGRKITPEQYIDAVLAGNEKASQDPVGHIKSVAQMYDIDLEALASDDPTAFDSEWHRAQEQMRQLAHQNQQLAQQVQALTQNTQQQQAQAELAPFLRMVDNFFNEKPSAHFEALSSFDPELEIFSRFVQAEAKKNPGSSHQDLLNKAWENIQFAIPELRRAVLSEQAHATNQLEQAERLRRAQSVKSASPGAEKPPQFRNHRERAAWYLKRRKAGLTG